MGRVSREARLTFIMLWTISDDAGRLRGNSRMLASLLFPYDDDAKDLMPGWLDELEGEGCIKRYQVGKDSYVQIENWLEHQKIDKPSASKIPAPESPREDSRILPVGKDQGKDQGSEDQGMDQGAATPAEPAPPASEQSKSKKPKLVTLPEGFAISERVRKWAIDKGHSRLDEHLENFVSTARAKAYQYADWDEAFMKAVRENWAKLSAPKASRHNNFAQQDYHAGVKPDGSF